MKHFDELERRGESPGALLEEMASMGYRFELRRSVMAIVRVVAR